MPNGSIALQVVFAMLAIALGLAFVHAVRLVTGAARPAALATVTWMTLTLVLAWIGVLRFTPFPPTMPLLILGSLLLAVGIARSSLGQRLAMGLPLALLVGFQGFRIAVELLLHRTYVEGLLPVQMTFEGANFDVVSGVSAVLLGLALALRPLPRWLVLGWNVLGLMLLANAVGIAMLSAPTPFRRYLADPSTVMVTRAPWVWLPTVMVLAALLGHLLVFRRLRAEPAVAAG